MTDDSPKYEIGEFQKENSINSQVFPENESTRLLDFIKKAGNLGKRAIEGAIVGIEVLPLNEAMRFGFYGWVEASQDSPIISGLALTTATFAIEASATYATADVLSRNGARRTRALLDWGLKKVGLKDEVKPNLAIEAGASFLGGSTIAMYIKDRSEKGRTKEQNKNYGLGWSAVMSGILGVQGTMLSYGIETPSLPTVGVASLGVGSFIGMIGWAKNKVKKANKEIEE